MRGDFSRLTFRPERHYSGVRLQQGRVQLDADFNEQVDIDAHRDRMTTRDVIGQNGVPYDGGGFAVSSVVNLRGAAFASGTDVWWAVGEDGALLKSADAGKTWTLQAAPAGVTATLEAVAFSSDTDGHAVGARGTILVTSDGGQTWTSLGANPLPGADLHGLAYVDPTHAWAVGDAATILFWNGSTWTQQQAQGATGDLRAVHFASASHGWIVGDAGTILVTSDAGQTWTAQASGVTVALRSIDFVDAQTGWAVGDAATILQTVDGGAQWAPIAVPAGIRADLRAVRFADAQSVAAVGDAGTILVIPAGGQPKLWPRTTADLYGLAVGGEPAQFVAVGDDVVLRGTSTRDAFPAALPPDGRTLTISAGDLYVDGIRVVNERTATFTTQPDFPLDPLPGVDPFPPAVGTYGIYLRARELHLTALERDELREVALGGPDTATRTKTVWQVRLTPKPLPPNASCSDFTLDPPPEPASSGLLRARAQPGQLQTSECMVPATGGYQRLENQLYRVEVHDAAAAPQIFKWSRDNGSIAALLEAITMASDGNSGSMTVSSTGRDDVLGFAPKQIAELTDEGRTLRGEPGTLVELTVVRGNILDFNTLVPEHLTIDAFPHKPTVRRWDGTLQVNPGTWTELESGVAVEFGDGAVQSGDWWTIPARTLTASVEWPQNGDGPEFRPPKGIQSHYAPLAVADVAAGVWSNIRDCRRLFPPLTAMVQLSYVGGDGQEVMPPVPLLTSNLIMVPRPLEVRVANGRNPVRGALVQFDVVATSGKGKVQLDAGAQQDSVIATTDQMGIASCRWWVDGKNPSQQVEAHFVWPSFPDPAHPVDLSVVRFNAHLSEAGEVAYTPPANCQELANVSDVQAAIDRIVLLPRLYPVSGDDVEVPVGTTIDLVVGVTSTCGLANALVRFEYWLVLGGAPTPAWTMPPLGRWTPLGNPNPVQPGPDGIASYPYKLQADARQFLRARLTDSQGNPLGYPVYFRVDPVDPVPPYAAARLAFTNAAVEIAPTGLTPIAFGPETAEFDTDTMHDPGVNPTRLTVKRPGIYLVTGEVSWLRTENPGPTGVKISTSGAQVGMVLGTAQPPPISQHRQQVTGMTQLKQAEFVELSAVNETVAPLAIDSATFSIAWLGA